MTTFNDLDFQPHPNWPDGIRAITCFPNGYAASVIRSKYSYGGSEGFYELAVMKGTEDDHELCYDTPITDNVIGGLTPVGVSRLLAQIAELPKA